ncbi:MAG TPA: CapA family protein [Candidatus Limnocylindrales bacterium]|nr:CapA family protein [Candidatus Limnocylindrales bacterium]
MSIRDPDYDPRRQHPRSGARPLSARPARGGGSRSGGTGGTRTPAVFGALGVIALLLLVGLGFGSGFLGGPRAAAPGAAAAVGSASPSPDASIAGETEGPDDPTASTSAPASAGIEPVESAEPAPPLLAETDVAIVPVTNFRSARTGIRAADIAALASGGSPIKALVLVEDDADAILAALDLSRGDLGTKLVTVASAEALAANLAKNRARVAFLRADDVGPSVRALAWGGKTLFGNTRVKSLAKWPLVARLPGPETPSYDPAGAWTLVAGGDILLDRGVSLALQANGADFPFDGGTVTITGRCKDCSPMGWDLPYTKRTGNAGIVRDLIKDADLAIANFENPAPDAFRWHGKGTVFSANPRHIAGLVDAGLDWVSLANNHIGDAGRKGMLQTMTNLKEYGLAYGGLGKNAAAAHKATLLKAGDVTVGILGYDQIARSYNATDTIAGSARMTAKALKADVKAARKAGADVVIVFPHWGVEYRAAPVESQRRLGKAAIDAGADLVIGNHPHWAEGMEVYQGKPIWYALGNFVFDQTWSEYTMEGITLELTFQGKELVQIRMRPHLILGKAQPNFMDPAGSGKFVMDQVWKASEGLLSW